MMRKKKKKFNNFLSTVTQSRKRWKKKINIQFSKINNDGINIVYTASNIFKKNFRGGRGRREGERSKKKKMKKKN